MMRVQRTVMWTFEDRNAFLNATTDPVTGAPGRAEQLPFVYEGDRIVSWTAVQTDLSGGPEAFTLLVVLEREVSR